MKIYNKLVRDGIPDIIRSQGQTPKTRILSDEEYRRCLTDKLQEEVAEFLADATVEELADILEVVYALVATTGASPANVEAIRQQKAEARGSFEQKIYLIGVEDA